MASIVYATDVAARFSDDQQRVSHEGDLTVVWLAGEHDMSTVRMLAETLAKAISRNDADLVVDLSEVTFLSAATVEELVRCRVFLRDHSRDLALRAPSPRAWRILEICGLTTLIACRP
jgi:anti-anti-sigma factor